MGQTDDNLLPEINSRLSLLEEQLQTMETFMKNQLETKDQMINSLHSELQYYKDEKSEKFVEQFMKSIIKIRKDMLKVLTGEQWSTMDADNLKEQYTYIFEDLTDVLQLQNIIPYSSKPGDIFDGKIHQAKSEATDDRLLDRTIKESLSEGFKRGEKILLPERVIVYSYQGGTQA